MPERPLTPSEARAISRMSDVRRREKLRAKIKGGNQKKIDFPHPTSYMYEPRGYVYEVGFFVRYSSQRWPMAIAPAQWHVGAPLRRSARQ